MAPHRTALPLLLLALAISLALVALPLPGDDRSAVPLNLLGGEIRPTSEALRRPARSRETAKERRSDQSAQRLDVDPPAAPHLTGRVTNRAGKPIIGANVRTGTCRTLSNSDGRYELAPEPLLRSHELRVSADGYACETIDLGVLGPAAALDVQLREEALCPGRVFDEFRTPLVGVRVMLAGFDEEAVWSDAQGRFELTGIAPDAKRVQVTISKAGFVPSTARVELPNPKLTLMLQRGSALRGRVVHASGDAAPGAEVALRAAGAQAPFTAFADASGLFELSDIPIGGAEVHARSGAGLSRRFDVDVPANRMRFVEIALPPGQSVRGQVLDERDRPIAGASVHTAHNSSTVTDADGRFEANLPVGEPIYLTVHALCFQSLRLPEAAPDEELLVHLESASRLSGSVTDQATGELLNDFHVCLTAPRAEPGKLPEHFGSGRLRQRPPGTRFLGTAGAWDSRDVSLAPEDSVRIEIRSAGYAPKIYDRMEVGAGSAPLETALLPGASLRGRVVERTSGAALAGARLRAYAGEEAGRPTSTTTVDADGRFEITGLPADPITLYVDRTGLPLAIDGPFELTPGSEALRTVSIGTGAQLRGQLLDEHGVPQVGELIRLRPLDPRPSSRLRTRTRADGQYSIEGLTPGRYEVFHMLSVRRVPRAADLCYAFDIATDESLLLDLQPGGHGIVRGTANFEGEPAHGFTVELERLDRAESGTDSRARRRSAVVEGGAFEASGLASGRWRVSAEVTGSTGHRLGSVDVSVSTGATVEVVVPLAPDERHRRQHTFP